MELPFNTPLLLALRLSDEPELEEGETNPLKLECAPIDDLMNLETYVVKFYTEVALNGFGIVSELIASHLAKHFGISTPDFALIEISDAFAKSAMGNMHTSSHILTRINQNKHSMNFGSKFIGGNTQTPLAMQNPTYTGLSKAENIFAFDALIYNADRTNETPNMFETKDSLIVFDHEKAFHFLFHNPMLIGPEEFGFPGQNGGTFLSSHIFRNLLHGRGLAFDNFVDMLQNLNDTIIDAIMGQIPYDLAKVHKSQIEAMRNYLMMARNNYREFRFALMRVLA